MSAQDRIADYLGVDPADVNPVKAREVMDELRGALADLTPGVYCHCSIRVADAIVTIRPCNRHRGLEGVARWAWLENVLTAAARVAV